MNDKELYEALNQWFNKQSYDKNTFSRGIRLLIKNKLIKLKRWKVAKRGNPSMGFKNMLNFLNHDT